MKIEEQVCSLELARKLKELGVKQDSYFYWSKNGGIFEPTGLDNQYIECAAFTVAELGEMLPEGFVTYHDNNSWFCWKQLIGGEADKTRYDWQERGATEADARAKMLIHLIETGLVKPEGIGA